MTDAEDSEVEEAEDEDGEEDETPEQTDVMAGTFIIFDTAEFAERMNCIGIQLTTEDGLYVLDRDTHLLRAVGFDDGKAKSKLHRVQ